MCPSKPEKKYECCGQTFNTKKELDAHNEKMHKKSRFYPDNLFHFSHDP